MKRTLWLICTLLSLRVGAQVSMTVQLPPAGVMLKAQLWNIVLVSASGRQERVKITLRLLDAQTRQPILTGITRTIILSKGAKQLQLADVMPVQYEYMSAAVDPAANGLLPAGAYIACYSLIVEGDKIGNQPGEDCVPFAIEPVSPPLLNTPANQSILDAKLPQFTWLPPAPVSLFNDLNYEMILVELHTGQSPQEAIQQNIPVYRAPRLRNIFASYPSGAAALDTTKQYAWTVIARNGALFAAQTEVWTFRIKAVNAATHANNSAYIQLKKELDGAMISCSELQCGYNNMTSDTTASYEIIALDHGNKAVYTDIIAIKRGENHNDIPLKRKGMDDGKSYLFRLKNSRNELWQLKFIYTREDQ